jgi:hypothetical protein
MTQFERLVLKLDRAKRRYQEVENRDCDESEFNPIADAQLDAEDALLDRARLSLADIWISRSKS